MAWTTGGWGSGDPAVRRKSGINQSEAEGESPWVRPCDRGRRGDQRCASGNYLGLLARIADGEIRAIGMMKDQRADAGFGVHHEAFGELYTDFFWLE